MGRTLNDLIRHLRETIENLQTDAHNASSYNKHRYNNLKIEIPEATTTRKPMFKISIGISEATYDMTTMEKISGSLGQDEKYIQRWLKNSTVIMDLKENWDNRTKLQTENSKHDKSSTNSH